MSQTIKKTAEVELPPITLFNQGERTIEYAKGQKHAPKKAVTYPGKLGKYLSKLYPKELIDTAASAEAVIAAATTAEVADEDPIVGGESDDFESSVKGADKKKA